METTCIKTMGLRCASCSALVELTLKRLPGVMRASSGLPDELTTIVFDRRLVDESEIGRAIEALGFSAVTVGRKRYCSDGRIIQGGGSVRPPDSVDDSLHAAPGRDATEGGDIHLLHVRTAGLRCEECTALVEETVSRLSGVKRVLSLRTPGLTSVLFDRSVIAKEMIVARIRRAGFGAVVVPPRG